MITMLLSFALTLAFGYAYYAQYFRWRGCFNEMGRCFDPVEGVVYHAQSGAVWLALACVAFAIFLYQLRHMPRARR
ncbi:hypothetical protein [Thioclava electrotropha]|uniref:Uncharacterized protein n=1 Tax=Thioclava electrotropha TaxID=1549850 RepID=A0ABX6YUL4_9RHOB|nr:hypothetical protein [Thioclava electrotropha]QPZ91433.1 hypothetical protein AKL02_011330 [Thioclava electrotropha]